MTRSLDARAAYAALLALWPWRREPDAVIGERLIEAIGDVGNGVDRRRIEWQWRRDREVAGPSGR